MEGGVLQQTGTPREIYETPANEFVATFVGDSNKAGGRFVRPEALRLTARPAPSRVGFGPSDRDAAAAVSAVVEKVLYAGSSTTYTVRLADVPSAFPYAFECGQSVDVLMLNNAASRPFSVGDAVWVQAV